MPKSCEVFSLETPIIDVWQGLEYIPGDIKILNFSELESLVFNVLRNCQAVGEGPVFKF